MPRFLPTVEAKRWLLTATTVTIMSLPLAVSAMVDGPNSVALVDSASGHSGAIGGAASSSVAVGGLIDAERAKGAPADQVADAGSSSVTGLEPGTLALMGFGLLALFLARRNAR